MRGFYRRLYTFGRWPLQMSHIPRELAKAGFFYMGDNDAVVCYCRGLRTYKWQKMDDPKKEKKEDKPPAPKVVMVSPTQQVVEQAKAEQKRKREQSGVEQKRREQTGIDGSDLQRLVKTCEVGNEEPSDLEDEGVRLMIEREFYINRDYFESKR
ncbi:putative inhibitor of apoptosis [Gigantopelta aegis]|uniref:putative inhibitor of apoptosis n=1 Tax=Gigantopelta aegis TaxID=1735272 RepID=UPI001B88E1AA|nr:putative inhibitor of apoptosis [Gigantopelta aegis]